MSSELNAFADETRRFVDWVTGAGNEEMDVATALRRIVSLYSAALQLPSPFSASQESEDVERVSDTEWKSALERALKLPLRYYGEVFDPLPVPPEEPVVGDVGDDIADIYRDVATGLRLFEAGDEGEALWEWGFSFRIHWGEHATGAIRALHGYLAQEDADGLSGRV